MATALFDKGLDISVGVRVSWLRFFEKEWVDSGDRQRSCGCPTSSVEKTAVFAGSTAIPQADIRFATSGNLTDVSNTGRVIILLVDETS